MTMDLENDVRFEQALDECCRRVRRGEALEGCLPDYPEGYREELNRLVPLAGRVSMLARDPSPEFQARLEARLLDAVDAARAGKRGSILDRLGHFLTSGPLARAVAVSAVVLLLGAGWVGADRASAGSLPDSPLYRVKAAREQLQLALARAPESQVDVRAAQLDVRGQELDQAVQGRKGPKVVETLVSRVETSVENMVDEALTARARGNPAPGRRAILAIRAADRRLETIIASAQPNVRPSLQDLRIFLRQQEQRLLPGGAGDFPAGTRQPLRTPDSAPRTGS